MGPSSVEGGRAPGSPQTKKKIELNRRDRDRFEEKPDGFQTSFRGASISLLADFLLAVQLRTMTASHTNQGLPASEPSYNSGFELMV